MNTAAQNPSTGLSPFEFQSHKLRVLPDEKGNPWFVAKDVCDILGYANDSKAIKDHCKAEGVTNRYPLVTKGGTQYPNVISEGNLYRLIIKSNKPEAEPFESFVCDEVLPAIRKTGQYDIKPNALRVIPSSPSKGGSLVKLPNPDSLLEQCKRFLADLVALGPVDAEVALQACKTAGFAEPTINRAKKSLGIPSRKTSTSPFAWEWCKPDGAEKLWLTVTPTELDGLVREGARRLLQQAAGEAPPCPPLVKGVEEVNEMESRVTTERIADMMETLIERGEAYLEGSSMGKALLCKKVLVHFQPGGRIALKFVEAGQEPKKLPTAGLRLLEVFEGLSPGQQEDLIAWGEAMTGMESWDAPDDEEWQTQNLLKAFAMLPYNHRQEVMKLAEAREMENRFLYAELAPIYGAKAKPVHEAKGKNAKQARNAALLLDGQP